MKETNDEAWARIVVRMIKEGKISLISQEEIAKIQAKLIEYVIDVFKK